MLSTDWIDLLRRLVRAIQVVAPFFDVAVRLFSGRLVANAKPEKVMIDLKAWATRRLKGAFPKSHLTDRWTQHGSTRYLWKEADLSDVVRYVVEEQGEPMAVHAGLNPSLTLQARMAENQAKSEPEA